METKYIKIPFDAEKAKKIHSGEIEGRIVTRNGRKARIVCFDRKGTHMPIIALVEIKDGEEDYFSYYENGHYDICDRNSKDLMLEIPEYVRANDFKFKPFDKVLCKGGGEWCLCQFSHSRTEIYTDTLVYVTVGGNAYEHCIPYEGNEHLLGTTKNPE